MVSCMGLASMPRRTRRRSNPFSPLTGVATIVGPLSGLSGNLITASAYGFDFNPVTDRILVTTDSGLNFRINPHTALVVGNDVTISLAFQISGAAYTNNETNNGGVTTLYTLDSVIDLLMIQGRLGGIPSPNGGVQTPVGFRRGGLFKPQWLRHTSGRRHAIRSGLALLDVGGATQLYSIDLVTGAGTLIGASPRFEAPRGRGAGSQAAWSEALARDFGSTINAHCQSCVTVTGNITNGAYAAL